MNQERKFLIQRCLIQQNKSFCFHNLVSSRPLTISKSFALHSPALGYNTNSETECVIVSMEYTVLFQSFACWHIFTTTLNSYVVFRPRETPVFFKVTNKNPPNNAASETLN